jgi:hypothetical protein
VLGPKTPIFGFMLRRILSEWAGFKCMAERRILPALKQDALLHIMSFDVL